MVDQDNNTQKSFSPEHVSLEKRFAQPESDNAQLHAEKEVQKETAHENSSAESDATYQSILAKVSQKSTRKSDDATVIADASTLDQKTDRESQITHLIDLATTKGVEHAVKVAQKAEDYYVLDQLHDRLLADDLHDALKSKGFIE